MQTGLQPTHCCTDSVTLTPREGLPLLDNETLAHTLLDQLSDLHPPGGQWPWVWVNGTGNRDALTPNPSFPILTSPAY